jgi:hypothetical protein
MYIVFAVPGQQEAIPLILEGWVLSYLAPPSNFEFLKCLNQPIFACVCDKITPNPKKKCVEFIQTDRIVDVSNAHII